MCYRALLRATIFKQLPVKTDLMDFRIPDEVDANLFSFVNKSYFGRNAIVKREYNKVVLIDLLTVFKVYT